MSKLDKITLRGYRSIQTLEGFELRDINIFVGTNGAGKSNLLSFFDMLRSIMTDSLHRFVNTHGTSDDLLYRGPRTTEEIFAEMYFQTRGYRFSLRPTVNQQLVFNSEAHYFSGGTGWRNFPSVGTGNSALVREVTHNLPDAQYSRYVYDIIRSWCFYHFHDTSMTAGMRRKRELEHWQFLQENADNIAPFLLRMRETHRENYDAIVDCVRSLLPAFRDFMIVPQMNGEQDYVRLDWKQKDTDFPMPPSAFSDGTMRFICLATALLQPNPPAALIIDEPELGLHPEGISLLAELLKASSKRTQMIIATQSPLLLNHFSVEDIVVARWQNGATAFKRLQEVDYKEWLEDFSLGDLWTRNIIDAHH